MRFLIDPAYHQKMLRKADHTPDCYVRPGKYLHHLYVDGVKYVVVQAMQDCLKEAQVKSDHEAIHHLNLHLEQYNAAMKEAQAKGMLEGAQMVGDPPPDEEEGVATKNSFVPREPKNAQETGLTMSFLFEMVLRTIYNRGRLTGGELSTELKLNPAILNAVLPLMRKQTLIDVVGQRSGMGDSGLEYEIKPPKGTQAVDDALKKTEYVGPTPVPFVDYIESVSLQTIKNITVNRRNIERAFSDLVITEAVFNEIGPAINSAASIFLFGYPGNGKTSVAERITRLMGDNIYIPYAIEVGGAIIKLYDPTVHELIEADPTETGGVLSLLKGASYDQRFVKIKRPTIVVGGELTLPMLDLKYNPIGRFYEAPVHMKANGGIFMIDDFGRQQVRPMDLLNRWIVPLEKRYDYLTTVTGNKIEIPFDELLIFSTNLDPNQLADEAFLRRIKFKIETRDPDESQWRQIWKIMCKSRRVEYDDKAIDYLIEKWYKPFNRPMRMCQPRDILDQMISIAKYNMERPSFNPDLLDAGCMTYFVSQEKKDFGAKVRLE
jgi:hypothetical protein